MTMKCANPKGIELHHEAVSRIKKEEMLQKINKNYRGEQLIFEDVQDRVRLIRKGRYPFIILSSGAFMLNVFTNWGIDNCRRY
jgi:hypothetical protein